MVQSQWLRITCHSERNAPERSERARSRGVPTLSKVLIVGALERELAPLLASLKPTSIQALNRAIKLYESGDTVYAFGGLGTISARTAVSAAWQRLNGDVQLIISAGLAGALVPELRVGTIFRPETIIDEADHQTIHLPDGDGVLVTTSSVANDNKQALAARFNAQAVDMEAYAVADVARIHKVPFLAVKAISDELDFPLPPLGRFISPDGRFRTRSFAAHSAVRPWTWRTVAALARNSARATAALCAEIQSLVLSFSTK